MSEQDYPALRRFFAGRAVQPHRGSGRPRMPLRQRYSAEDLPSDAVAGVAADLRALLAEKSTDADLTETVVSLGRHATPRWRRATHREWLEVLVAALEDRLRREEWERGFDQPRQVRAERLRPRVVEEVSRIGVEELARRTRVSIWTIRRFLQGYTPLHGALDAFYLYEFGTYPDLKYLLGCYFHEDYDVESPLEAWGPVVDRFLSAESAGLARGVAIDIDRLLGSVSDDAELQRSVEEMGNRFATVLTGLTEREWLQAVRDRLPTATR